MKLTGETKLFLGILLVTLVIVVGGVYVFSKPVAPEAPVPREQLISGDSNMRGNASGSAYLVEFSDFQCPACYDAQPYVKATVDKYKDSLLFVYRHFPLDKHPFAQKAAVAAEAAALQGKFWEAHDYLFQNQVKLSDELINNLGKELGLDEKKYMKDLTDENLKKKVLADQSAGFSLGVNATPTFYLNGQKLTLANFTDLDKLVEAATKSQ